MTVFYRSKVVMGYISIGMGYRFSALLTSLIALSSRQWTKSLSAVFIAGIDVQLGQTENAAEHITSDQRQFHLSQRSIEYNLMINSLGVKKILSILLVYKGIIRFPMSWYIVSYILILSSFYPVFEF